MLSLNEVKLELNTMNDTALREELLSNAEAILTT